MAMLETLVQLFAAFAKIGFTSFGGTSMIPLIMDEMSSHGWMTDADLTNLIAIAEMTPGSLGVNAATFAGTKTAGMPGGVFAVLGVLSPTLTLTLLAAAFFQKFRTSKVMSYIMKIVKPVCIGMVLGVLVGLCRQTCITEAGGISLPGIAIGILCFVLLQKFKLSVPKVIGIAAVLGLVCFGVFLTSSFLQLLGSPEGRGIRSYLKQKSSAAPSPRCHRAMLSFVYYSYYFTASGDGLILTSPWQSASVRPPSRCTMSRPASSMATAFAA